MDIFAIKNKDTAIMEVFHPITGEDTGIRIEIYAPDSPQYTEAINNLPKQKKEKLTPELIEKNYINILAACTASWENIEHEGKSLECNFENAVNLYTKLSWLKKRVGAFIDKEANFLEQSPSN